VTRTGVTRREFLVVSGTAAAGTVVLGGLGFDLSPAQAYARELRIKVAKETTTICCCSVGCGILVHTRDGNVINTEGDPDHPVSEGSLCPKGGTLSQVVTNANRLLKPRHRAPGATAWKDVEWDWALDRIARRVKETRDRTFRATTKRRSARSGRPTRPTSRGSTPRSWSTWRRSSSSTGPTASPTSAARPWPGKSGSYWMLSGGKVSRTNRWNLTRQC
jgi:formate dehydrogenase major subunit